MSSRRLRTPLCAGPHRLRGYPHLSLAGSRVWLLNQEWRFPILNALALAFPFGTPGRYWRPEHARQLHEAGVEQLRAVRDPLYKEAADVIISTDNRRVPKVADLILRELGLQKAAR